MRLRVIMTAGRGLEETENVHFSPIVYEGEDISDSEDDADDSNKKAKLSSSVNDMKGGDQTAKMKYLFRDARYFLIKSNNHENIALAKAKGVWSTLPYNEQRLNAAFREARNVLLIFSVKESGKFQGFARMRCESRRDGQPINWVLPNGMNRSILGGVFKVDWITRNELPFTKTTHLYNPWNDSKPVKIGRDGQEIESKCGESVCRLFPRDENIDVVEILRAARRRREEGGHHPRPVPKVRLDNRHRRMDNHNHNRNHRDYRPRGGMKRRMQPSRDDRRRMRPPPSTSPPPLLDPPRDLLMGPSYSDYLRDYSNRSMGMPMPPYPSQNYYDPMMPFPPSYPPAPPMSSHRLGDYPPPLSPPMSSRRDKERDHRDRDRDHRDRGDRGERRMRRNDHGRDRSKRDHHGKDRRGRSAYDRTHADECEEFLRRATARQGGSGSGGGYGSRHGGRRSTHAYQTLEKIYF
eukprot:XP_011681150.1 PREDICTED: YTH domain-containing protein 1 isoform X3 [Strongylocentrotus purpuratus]